MFFELLKWWYGSGWLDAWQGLGRSIRKTQLAFSVPALIKNLFAPWKQIVALPGRTIDERFRGMIDNLISRTIGFFVRLLTLMAAAVVIIFSAVLGLMVAVAWPLVPIALVYCIARTITG